MATSAAVLEDSSLLSRLDRALLPLERFMALLSGLAIFSLMFLAAWSVGGRKFLGMPLLGYIDYIEALMPVIAILAGALLLAEPLGAKVIIATALVLGGIGLAVSARSAPAGRS
mgnify:CR=1 FL=1